MIPALAIAGGSYLLNHLFNRTPDYHAPPAPTFFGPDFDKYMALIRQKTQAEYGGAGSMLRENLGNAGLLSSGAYPTAVTQLGIQEGSDIAGQIAGGYGNEFAVKRAFESGPGFEAGLTHNRDIYTQDVARRQGELSSLTSLAGSIGKSSVKPDATPYAGTGPNPSLDPNDPLYWILNQGKQDPAFMKRLLSGIFGIGG